MTRDAARMYYRATEIRGHEPGCVIAHDWRQCSCIGRVRLNGSKWAEYLDKRQADALVALVVADPDAGEWLASRGLEIE